MPIQAPRPICDGRAATDYGTLTRTTRVMRAVTYATCRRIWGMPASARPLTIRKGMTPDATRPLMGSSRTRYQRAGRSGSCGARLCALRMKINPAPARLDVKAGFLQNHQPFTSLIACLESRHIHTSPTTSPTFQGAAVACRPTQTWNNNAPESWWEWTHDPPLARLSMATRPLAGSSAHGRIPASPWQRAAGTKKCRWPCDIVFRGRLPA